MTFIFNNDSGEFFSFFIVFELKDSVAFPFFFYSEHAEVKKVKGTNERRKKRLSKNHIFLIELR